MGTTPIDIPVTVAGTNTPSVDLSAYTAEDRTFAYVNPNGGTVAIFASGDGSHWTTGPLLTLAANSKAVTLSDRSLRYRAVPSTTGGTLTVDEGLANDGGQLFYLNTLALGNFPTGGAVATGTELTEFGALTIAQTTAGQTLTLPTPANPSATRQLVVQNIGSQGFVMLGLFVGPATTIEVFWNGSRWAPIGAGTTDGTDAVLGTEAAAGSTTIDAGTGGIQALTFGAGLIEISADAGSGNQESLFVKSAAGVGINQSSPSAALHVKGAVLWEPPGASIADGTGSLGTAAATIDGFSVLKVNQTTPVITYANMRTLPAPTNTQAGRKVTICNVGTAAFIIGDAVQKQGINLVPGATPGSTASANKGQSVTWVWNGFAWVPEDTGPGAPCQGGNLADSAGLTVVRAGRCTVYHVPSLGTGRTWTLGVTGALIGDQIGIIRDDGTQAVTLTIQNAASTTLAVLPASKKAILWAEYVGSDWQLLSGGAF